MSETPTPALAVRTRASTTRTVGLLAIAYAATLFLQNALFAITAAPDLSDPLGVVLAYHAQNRRPLAITSGLEALNMLLLLSFLTALHGLVLRRGGHGSDNSRLALAAGSTLSALSALTIATHIAVVLTAAGQPEPTPAFELAWRLHAATFALTLPAFGVTFLAATLPTHQSGLTRPWQRPLGLTAGTLPLLAGTANLAIANGSPLLYVGVAGLTACLAWLTATGLQLLRQHA